MATLAGTGLLVCAPAWAEPSVPTPSDPVAQQGLQFVCASAPRARVWAGMRDYLHELGVPERLVAVTDDPQRGTLTYTLRTPPGDTSTLDYAHRPGYWVYPQTIRVPAAHGQTREVDTVSDKEILLALMQPGRRTELAGKACSLPALREHIGVRQNIVAWAERLQWPWPDGTPARWDARYWRDGVPRPGVPLQDALRHPFVQPQAYAFGCYTAAKLVFAHGVLDYHARVQRNAANARQIEQRLLADGEPLQGIEPDAMWRAQDGFEVEPVQHPGKLLRVLTGVAPRHFVPGDWAYFRNTDAVSWEKSGYEGSNAIYLGRGRFVDFYNDNGHSYTYEQKLEEVYQWRHGVFSQSRDHELTRPLSAQDLERLGQSPREGGLLLMVRAVPYFFGFETLPEGAVVPPLAQTAAVRPAHCLQ